MKIEVRLDEKFSAEELARVEFHSLLNVLNVIAANIQMLVHAAQKSVRDTETLGIIATLVKNLGDRQKVRAALTDADGFADVVRRDYHTLSCALSEERHVELAREIGKSLEKILDVLGVRAAELLSRMDDPRWIHADPSEIKRQVEYVLETIALNSMGKFNVCFSREKLKPHAILFEIEVRGAVPGKIFLPPEMIDSFRDLIANARKYSESGAHVSARLIEDADGVLVEVGDDGMGIPAEEMPMVARMGYRASNARGRRTMGAGFGLTKAYVNARRYGGRMWIDSEPGGGTVVTIRIPKPA